MAASTLLSAVHVYTLRCAARGSIAEMKRNTLYIDSVSFYSQSSNVDSFPLYEWDSTNKIKLSKEALCLIFCEYGVCVGVGSNSPMAAISGSTLFYTDIISYVTIYGHGDSHQGSNTIYISVFYFKIPSTFNEVLGLMLFDGLKIIH